MADRPAPELEIEITPEMIEAGASVLCGFNTYYSGEEHWAEEVYRAMRALSPEVRGRVHRPVSVAHRD